MKIMNKRGISLIEILVTLAIAGIVFAAIYEIYLSVQKQGLAQDEIAEMHQNIRIPLDQIIKELRISGYNTGDAEIYGNYTPVADKSITLGNTNTNTITIQGDFDDNTFSEVVQYDIQNDANGIPVLKRCHREGVNPFNCEDFASNITSLKFYFYDENNEGVNPSTVSTSSSVRRVAVTITGRTKQHPADSPLGKLWPPNGYKEETLTSEVVIRNFGEVNNDSTPPACPTNIVVSATGNCGELQITWTWSGTDADLAGFLITYTASNGLDTGTLTVSDPDARSTLLQNRQNGVSYSINVTAYDRYINKSTCTPSPLPSDAPSNSGGAPNPPEGFSATPGDNQVTLAWNTFDTSITNNSDVKGFRIYRGTTPSFNPDSTNMIACERTKSGEPLPTGCPAGKNVLSVADPESGWTTASTSFTDTTAANCTKYYYIIRSVDRCLVESPNSQVVSATPPDNDKKPATPAITSLLAGDDTSSIIVDWTLTYNQSDTTHSQPSILRVYYKVASTSTWNQWGSDIPIDTGNPATLSGRVTLNLLQQSTLYDIKISAFDSAAMCSNESDVTASNTGSISTAECAPKISWGTRGGHFIFPGITTTGTALANNSKVGTDPDTIANSRFLTWIADPLDCTPNSSNYDRDGFDYSDPPAYTTVSPAQVEFYINNSGSTTDTAANIPYNYTGINQFVDTAPRSSDGYYHWPVFPLNNSHIDTSRLCNGTKDFTIRAVDGETYTAENTIILEIKNGGIEHNSSVATISNITTPNDYHNQVVFGLRNSSTVKDLRINKMALSWTNTFVNLKKIEIFNSSNVLIGLFDDTLLPVDTASGTEVTLTTIPTITTGSTATVKATFTRPDGTVPNTADMRGKTVSINSISFQDNTDPGFNCAAASLASLTSPAEPVTGGVTQDKPAVDTPANTTPNLLVAANSSVVVSLPITDLAASITSVRIQYAVDTFGSLTAPTRPSNLTDFGNYPNLVAMAFDSLSGLWKGTIPANNNARVWYFIEAVDSTGNFDISPDQGAYTYAQCGTTLPTVVFNTPPTPPDLTNVNNMVTVEVTASSAVGISSVFFFTDPASSTLVVPQTLMAEVSPGIFRGKYDATSGNLRHVLKVTVTDNCGNQQTISRTYN